MRSTKFTTWFIPLSAALACLALGICVFAEDAAKVATTGPDAQKEPWVAIPDSALQMKTGNGAKVMTVSNGIIAGIAVDRTNGDVYAVMRNSKGVWKSVDRAVSFHESGPLAGQNVTSTASMNLDPAGNHLAVFAIYGAGGITLDGGKTWTAFDASHPDEKLMGKKYLEYGAVDWEASGKAILAAVHESKGRLLLSTDAGATWTDLGTGFLDKGPVGIIDAKTLLAVKAGKPALQRSTDSGATWTKVADLPKGHYSPVIYVFKGVCYLMTEQGLMVSKDKGVTWAVQGAAVKANIGPFIGKDEDHLAAVGPGGCYETQDGGKTWTLVAPLPPKVGPYDVTYAWDPIHDIFYEAQHDHTTMKCVVGGEPGEGK